jgi:hypothetical protein
MANRYLPGDCAHEWVTLRPVRYLGFCRFHGTRTPDEPPCCDRLGEIRYCEACRTFRTRVEAVQ